MLPRLLHTLRHLRVRQVAYRVLRQVPRPRVVAPCVEPRVALHAPVPWVTQADRRVSDSELRFLNTTRSIAAPTCWSDPLASTLWRYQLHYFQNLLGHSAAAHADWHAGLIARWIAENPPFGGDGWHSYPVSQRIVNWIKWGVAIQPLSESALESLALQLEWLSRRMEFHLLGNHLLENAKALSIGGCFFEGAVADRWRSRGLALYQRELGEQILADGGHFERSPMYQSLILEGMLDLINVLDTYGFAADPVLRRRAAQMLDWLKTMSHPDGDIVLFNDAALGEAAKPASLVEYAQRLAVEDRFVRAQILRLRETGYIAAHLGDAALYFDAGQIGPDYLPAHAHADTLTFELSLHGQRVIVDTGTSTYERGPRRELERSTSAHNTVTIDRQNSSDVWHAFRVGRRARCELLEAVDRGESVHLEARHDGYAHFAARAVHSRSVKLTLGSMRVIDCIIGHGSPVVVVSFHLHPELEPTHAGPNVFEVCDRLGKSVCEVHCDSIARAYREPFEYAPEFGKRVTAWCLRVVYSGPLPVTMENCITWRR